MKKITLLIVSTLLLVCSSCYKDIPKTKYYPNGNIEELCHMRNGELFGVYKNFYENGTLRGEGVFRKGRPVGVWHYYYSNGEIMTIEKHNRRGKTVDLDCWDETGVQVIKDGTGTFIQYYPDGSIKSKASFNKCMFDEANEAWYANGVKEHEFYYENGRPVGTWQFWNEDGTLIRTEKY